MKKIEEFFQTNYPKAIELKKQFRVLEKKEWDETTVLAELTIQVSHLYNVIFSDPAVNEIGRNIHDLGDEISDVLLQLSYLAYVENVDVTKINNYEAYNYNKLSGVNILLGQLIECILEKNEYRFDKNRPGFNKPEEFIEDRILKLFKLVSNFAESNLIDINTEFEKMYEDATSFISKKVNE
jgi:NTP pyrophosphatase (non-canonical NTP hydrolase)